MTRQTRQYEIWTGRILHAPLITWRASSEDKGLLFVADTLRMVDKWPVRESRPRVS